MVRSTRQPMRRPSLARRARDCSRVALVCSSRSSSRRAPDCPPLPEGAARSRSDDEWDTSMGGVRARSWMRLRGRDCYGRDHSTVGAGGADATPIVGKTCVMTSLKINISEISDKIDELVHPVRCVPRYRLAQPARRANRPAIRGVTAQGRSVTTLPAASRCRREAGIEARSQPFAYPISHVPPILWF